MSENRIILSICLLTRLSPPHICRSPLKAIEHLMKPLAGMYAAAKRRGGGKVAAETLCSKLMDSFRNGTICFRIYFFYICVANCPIA